MFLNYCGFGLFQCRRQVPKAAPWTRGQHHLRELPVAVKTSHDLASIISARYKPAPRPKLYIPSLLNFEL